MSNRITFLKRNSSLLSKLLSKFYNFGEDDLMDNKQELVIRLLNYNTNIVWTDQKLKILSQDLNLNKIFESANIQLSINSLKQMHLDEHWSSLSKNESLFNVHSTVSLLFDFKDKWNWDKLSSNEGLHWTEELIENYEEQWTWNKLSCNSKLPWSFDLIYKYEDKWNWFDLSGNEGIPWTIEFIEQHASQWNWQVFGISSNEKIPWSIEFIDKHRSKLSWGHCDYAINMNTNKGLPWSIEFLEKYREYWVWKKDDGLIINPALPWGIQLLEKYEDIWFSSPLIVLNEGISWDIDLIKHFEKQLNQIPAANGLAGICANNSTNWSLELISYVENSFSFDKCLTLMGNSESFWNFVSPKISSPISNLFHSKI